MAADIKYFIGVDVGTQSVRAGLVSTNGSVLKINSLPITTYNPSENLYEQSSEHIWNLCVETIKEIIKDIDPLAIGGIGFDATCSLVAVDGNGKPLSLSNTGNDNHNIILWMDHRAVEEANSINNTRHKVLNFVGGKISPEMEIPKLLWIKKNLPTQWKRIGHFFDLPDFLTWKATGSLQRSLCSFVCKWTYLASNNGNEGWQKDFFNEIGLEDLLIPNAEKIGNEVLMPGQPCGQGLNDIAAKELGLLPGTPVSTSIIDAHAGGLGVLLCKIDGENLGSIEERLALICGTSTCHMKVTEQELFTPGVWGPYYSAMVPGFWCSEAGQSAAGALLDHIIYSHPASVTLKKQISVSGKHITELLNETAIKLKEEKQLSSVSILTKDCHVYPDFHGNRSPIADPNLKGMVCGLTLSNDMDDLVQIYLAALQALAYSTKHIISALEENGHTIKTLLVCGGLAKNNLYLQMHADVTGLPVIVPNNSEPVILGSAILAASAAQCYSSVLSAMSSMCGTGKLIKPSLNDKKFHEIKYKAYHSLLSCQQNIREIMSTL